MRRTTALPPLLLLVAGCGAGWHRVETAPDTALDPRTQYLVHHGGSADRWHAVRVTADSVSGVSWLRPIECDSCRVAFPRAAVDSLEEGHPSAGFWKGVGLAFFGPPMALSIYCILTGHAGSCWIPPET